METYHKKRRSRIKGGKDPEEEDWCLHILLNIIIQNIFTNLHCDKNKDCFSEYEMARATIIILTSFARERTKRLEQRSLL